MEPLVCQLVPVVMVFFGLHNNVRHIFECSLWIVADNK
jgi:hypothetical protein